LLPLKTISWLISNHSKYSSGCDFSARTSCMW